MCIYITQHGFHWFWVNVTKCDQTLEGEKSPMDRFWHLCYQFAIRPLEIDDINHIFL